MGKSNFAIVLGFTLLLLAGRAEPKPPGSPRFVRAGGLAERIKARQDELRREEEFRAKPRAERLLIRFREGAAEFDGEPLVGELVVKELLQWNAEPAERDRVFALAPPVFKKRYGFVFSKSKKLCKQRYQASKLLVGALTHLDVRIRVMAIESLDAMYVERHGYDANATAADRARKQKQWRRAIQMRK